MTFTALLLIAFGGALGASLRFITTLAAEPLNRRFSFLTGTAVANSIGCLGAGIFTAWAASSSPFDENLTNLVLIGILGSYTTFSTFTLEVFKRLDKPIGELLSYLVFQLVFAVGLVFAGYSFTLQWLGGIS